MAESVQAAECPATPERVDQCPETPDRLLNMKSPDSSTSSDNECTINLRTRNSNSPPPNCAICLGRCKNKCFTDSCLHQFCFKCLLEWSKVKAECPLCKQPFNSIIHNVKSIDQFEEYLVAQPQQAPPSIPSVPLPIPPLASSMDHSLYSRQLDMYLGQYTRFRRNGFSTTVQVHPADNNALQQIFLHRSLLVERLRHEYADGVIPPNMLGELWRRYIYDRRLYAMPVVDITGRYRECSARFFRDNPAQMHRIMNWIDRDARCLLRDSEHHAAYLLEGIRDVLPVFNITSPEFRRHLQPFFGQRTAHFIHELLNFARSPFDIIGYDREVRYSPYYEEVVISSSSSSSGFSDTEDVIHVRGGGASGTRRPGRTEVTIETRSNNSTFIITGTINGSGASGTGSSGIRGDNSVPSSSLPAEIIEVGRTPFEDLLQPQILGESQVIQIDRNIVLSSSSSDECEFVCEQKPPHLRTPEQVSLNSESDSDCVFVGESHRTPTIEPAAHTKRKRKPPRGVFISSLSAPSSSSSLSSESDYETVNKREAKSKSKKKKKNKNNEPKKPKDNNTTTTNNPPDNIKTESSQPTPAPITSSELASHITDCNNSNANDEYNNGASTSSGLPSSGGGGGGAIASTGSKNSSSIRSQAAVKKYYARPVRQATSKRVRNGKSIYEESSCDTDESSTEDKAFERTFKCEKMSDSDDSTENRLRKNRKRKHERVRRRQSNRRHSSSATTTSKKKKSKKSSARKKLSSSIAKSSKRRKISKSKTAQQQQQHRRRPKTRKLSSTKRSSSISSAMTSSLSSSTTTTSSSSSSTTSSSESANREGGWSSSSSD